MIKENLGKVLVIGNLVVLILLIYGTFTPLTLVNIDVLAITQICLALVSIMVFSFVLRTYKTFNDKDLLVGVIGFLLLAISYSLVVIVGVTKVGVSNIEIYINILITLGYLLITLAAGWIK